MAVGGCRAGLVKLQGFCYRLKPKKSHTGHVVEFLVRRMLRQWWVSSEDNITLLERRTLSPSWMLSHCLLLFSGIAKVDTTANMIHTQASCFKGSPIGVDHLNMQFFIYCHRTSHIFGQLKKNSCYAK